MTQELIDHNVPIPTMPPARPYAVRLVGGPARDGEIVVVYDQAIVGERCIVRSAHGEGYWYGPAGAVAAADADGALVAVFQPHTSASFMFPRR